MQVDFYQLAGEAVEAVLPQIAGKCLAAGERLLVVAGDEALRARIGQALWENRREPFLAHGQMGEGHETRQPILLSSETVPVNGARFMALADGVWRDPPEAVERVFLLFGADRLEEARACWRALAAREGVNRRFWKRAGGRWVEGP